MRSDPVNNRMWICGGVMAVLAVVTALLDRAGTLTPLRSSLHDALSPGRLILLSLSNSDSTPRRTSSPAVLTPAESARLLDSLRDSERQRRQLILDNARLRHQLQRQLTQTAAEALLSPLGTTDTNRLAGFTPVLAGVIGTQGLSGRLRTAIVDAGAVQGVTRSELVVDGTGLLLDQGADSQVAAGDRVLSGSIVVGRIAKAGRWVSLVQPVTDKDFSARIQLLRSSDEGVHFGAEGLLQGTGESDCVISGIPYTEAVSVGDEVVTAEVEGVKAPRLYVGRVVQADFLEGGQWLIRVQPAVAIQELDRVAIVRMQLTPPPRTSPSSADRVAGQRQEPLP